MDNKKIYVVETRLRFAIRADRPETAIECVGEEMQALADENVLSDYRVHEWTDPVVISKEEDS